MRSNFTQAMQHWEQKLPPSVLAVLQGGPGASHHHLGFDLSSIVAFLSARAEPQNLGIASTMISTGIGPVTCNL